MGQLKKAVVLLLCMMHNAQGMEVWGETKSPEKRLLINENKQSHYSSLINPYDNKLNIKYEYGKTEISFVAYIANLPHDIRTNILSKLFSTTRKQDAKIRVKLLSLDHDLVLTLFCRAQKMCPLWIGNKKFGWKDLIMLTKGQQKELASLHNPSGRCDGQILGSDKRCSALDILKKQPDYIKKDLIVRLHESYFAMHPVPGLLVCAGLCMPPFIYSTFGFISLCTGQPACAPFVHAYAWGACGGMELLPSILCLADCVCIQSGWCAQGYSVDKNADS